MARAERHLHEKPAGDVGTVVKASTGSELGGQPCSTTAAHSSWWDTPAFSAACKKFSLFPDTTGNSEMEQAALFIPKQIPGTCLPINSQRRPGGSRDSSAGRREIRDCPLALFKKVPFTAFPSANLRLQHINTKLLKAHFKIIYIKLCNALTHPAIC